jgi:high-affinity nickel-transport protein
MGLRALIGAIGGGFGTGLVVAAFWFGFRHGIDWDHIAAITDITSSQEDRRRSIVFGTLYVVGHAVVVFGLGVVAIVIGERLPPGVDEFMGRVVGVTLIVLGVYVFASLIRHGRDFRLRSRWMLVFSGVRGAWRRVRSIRREPSDVAVHDHDREPVHTHGGGAGSVAVAETIPASDWHHGHHGLPGHHHHKHPERDEAFMQYQRGTAFLVGMLHGVGAETPTQILIFTAAAGAGGAGAGVAVLGAFIVGLVVSNSVITLGSTLGFLQATRNFAVYATVAVVAGTFSLVIGVLFVLGQDSVLPAFFAG